MTQVNRLSANKIIEKFSCRESVRNENYRLFIIATLPTRKFGFYYSSSRQQQMAMMEYWVKSADAMSSRGREKSVAVRVYKRVHVNVQLTIKKNIYKLKPLTLSCINNLAGRQVADFGVKAD